MYQLKKFKLPRDLGKKMRLQYNFGGLFTIFYLNLHPR
jgi:hypothetical protein